MSQKWDSENMERLTYAISKNNPNYEDVYLKLKIELNRTGKSFTSWLNENFKKMEVK